MSETYSYKGSGAMGLFVPCEKCDGLEYLPCERERSGMCCQTARKRGASIHATCEKGKLYSECGGYDKLCTCTDGKRPLTVAEVEEIFNYPIIGHSVEHVDTVKTIECLKGFLSIKGAVKFKGQLVTIAPLEGKV